MMTRTLVLELQNCDMAAEDLEELFADALDGSLPVDDADPIVVSVSERGFLRGEGEAEGAL